MLSAPVSENKTKEQQGKAESEFEMEGDKRSGGWAGYGSLSPGSGRLAAVSQPMGKQAQQAVMQKAYGNQAMLRMMDKSPAQTPVTASPLSRGGILQRKCACGNAAGASGTCATCQEKGGMALPGNIQTKLTINEPGDRYEQEADRVADQVLAAPTNSIISGVPPRIQRFTGQTTGRADMAAPASVDHVLSSPGRPLEPSLQKDMGQRFSHDFSSVRVHTGAAAERSARDVNANAYTVGHNIVFGAGRYAPGTHEGRRLLAHELTHTVQQNSARNLDSDVKREQLSRVGSRLVQRDGESNVPTLDELYNNALQAARQTGGTLWQDVAEKLNGFNHEDIQSRLAQLTQDEIGYIHQGALDNPRVGPDSQVAQLTKPGTPLASTSPPQTTPAPAQPSQDSDSNSTGQQQQQDSITTPAPTPVASATSYRADPSALNEAVSILQKFYSILDTDTLNELFCYKTIAVGIAIEKDNPDVPRRIWSAAGNWKGTNGVVEKAMDSLDVHFADIGETRSERGDVGAPGDAEQRMLEYAEDASVELVVKAMAVSRNFCFDCVPAIQDYEQEYGPILNQVLLPPKFDCPPPKRDKQPDSQPSLDEALSKLDDYRQQLQNQLDLNYGSHKSQSDLINQPSVTGFVGFWTNHLFNSDVPPLLIWNNAYGALVGVRSDLKRKDGARALRNLVRARRAYLIAYKRYMTWKNGIDSAGTKAQEAIGIVAIASVVIFVAPLVVAALASESAGGVAATELTTARILTTIANADETFVVAEALQDEAEIMAESGLEAETEVFQMLAPY